MSNGNFWKVLKKWTKEKVQLREKLDPSHLEKIMQVIRPHLIKQAAAADLHHAFKAKKPTVKTLAKLVNCCS